VRITMGLGNQMFQYATGLALSLEKEVQLKVDTSLYNGYALRKYELKNFFNIQTEEAIQEEIKQYRYNHPVKRVWNKIFPNQKLRVLGLPYEEKIVPRSLLALHDFIIPAHKRKTYLEPHYHFDKNFFKASGDVYLQGYWMSWRYFEKYDDEIKKAFTINHQRVAHLANIVTCLQKQNSIGVHIRRTDITDPKIAKLKGNIPVKFYLKGIEYIRQREKNIHVYFFSDDINWVKENLIVRDAEIHFADHSISVSPLEDFYLMTQCKHNIIANSTFSWWAAYLNHHPGKIIVAPKKWYNEAPFNYKDVYPPSWVLI
jgi:Glycosyl transferase family 11